MGKGNYSEPKRHHFVPECYLKNFLRDGKLYSLNVGNIRKGYKKTFAKKCHPSGICVKDGYYTIPENNATTDFWIPEEDQLFIEKKVLHKLEHKYGSLFQAVVSANPITIEQAKDWCDFIILLKMRNPFWEKNFITRGDFVVLDKAKISILNLMEENNLYQSIPFSMKEQIADEYIRSIKNTPQLARNMRLKGIATRYWNPGRAKIFHHAMLNARWQLLQAPVNGPVFLTSDNPGMSINEDGTVENIKLTDNVTFYMPVSSEYCIAVDISLRDEQYSDAAAVKNIYQEMVSASVVELINDKVHFHINDIVICSDMQYLNKLSYKLQRTVR